MADNEEQDEVVDTPASENSADENEINDAQPDDESIKVEIVDDSDDETDDADEELPESVEALLAKFKDDYINGDDIDQISDNLAKSIWAFAKKSSDDNEKEIAALEKERDEFKDKWMRTYADMENLRKRTALEKQDSLKYANFNIISDLLTILDNFQLAIEAGEKEPFDKDNYVNGIKMIENQFIDLLFKKYGVVKYGEQGEAFDPNIHQAMMMEEGDYEKDELAMVFRSGYKLHDRVVRPAQVKVGKPAAK